MTSFQSGIRALAAAFAIAVALHGQTLNTIYNFAPGKFGYHPAGSLVVTGSGALYGITLNGGTSGMGAVYQLVPPAAPGGTWTEQVLHSFSSRNGDGVAVPGLAPGSSGSLYGATGYNKDGGDGTIFQLRPPASTATKWREPILHAFTNTNGDGESPAGPPALGPHGVLYGATIVGGVNGGGNVYRLAPPRAQGGAWTEQILHSFRAYPGDGIDPTGALAIDNNGALYGGTSGGGASEAGIIFQLTPPTGPGGDWTETILHSFGGESDWPLPNPVLVGAGGVLYGTALGDENGNRCRNGCGTVFQLSPPASQGGNWTETILHTFTGVTTGDGSQPNSLLVPGPSGVLYGTTWSGGTPLGTVGYGTIFEMVPPSSPGGAWTEVVLYAFTGGADGQNPTGVTLGPDGNLYGTTEFGGVSPEGTRNQGTAFQLVLK